MKPRILFLVPSSLDNLKKKGVAGLLNDREDNGFFERVVTVHPFSNKNQTVQLTPYHRLYEIKEFYLPFCQGNKLLRYPHHLLHFFRLIFRLARITAMEKPDIIRAQDTVFTGPLAWILSVLSKRPFCVSIHSDDDKLFEIDPKMGAPTILGLRGLAKKIEKFILSKADLVMPISAWLAKKMIARGVSADKIRVIPHGVDFDSYTGPPKEKIRDKLGLSNNLRIIGFVGRLSKEKYVYTVIRLAAELKKIRTDFIVVLAGDGPERGSVEKLVNEMNIGNQIRLVGFQAADFLISLRKECSLELCFLSGFSLIEACAAACPVVALNVEWHSELIHTGETGILVPENDMEELVKAVNNILDHPQEAIAMANNARRLAFDRHDIKKASVVKQQIYNELLQH